MEDYIMYNKFGSSVFGNDDDIFDDSKTLSDSQSSDTVSEQIKNPNSKNNRAAVQSILDVLNKMLENENTSVEDAKNLIKHIREEHGIDLNSFMGHFRVKLSTTILDGAGSWITEFQRYIIPRSVAYALDSLSENKFSIVDKFFNLELENAKRIVINKFLKEVFLKRFNSKTNLFSEVFNEGVDSRYIKTFYEVLYEINEFTIWQNNGVYSALGQELDLPCNQDILDCKEVSIDNLSPETYSETRFASVLTPDLKSSIGHVVAEYTERYLNHVSKKND